MAKGDVTLTAGFRKKRVGMGGEQERYFSAVLDNYKTNGYDLSALANYGFGTITFVRLPPTVIGYVPEYDYTNNYVKFYYGDNNNASDGPLIEVPDNDSGLNGSTLRFEVFGVVAS